MHGVMQRVPRVYLLLLSVYTNFMCLVPIAAQILLRMLWPDSDPFDVVLNRFVLTIPGDDSLARSKALDALYSSKLNVRELLLNHRTCICRILPRCYSVRTAFRIKTVMFCSARCTINHRNFTIAAR